MIRSWIEAMRLRTLPVSIAGVIAGTGCAVMLGSFKAVPAIACLVFAILAQIAANFGNEYYDYRNGIDRKGRAGFRRGVTEGEIDPRSMKWATFIVLALAAAVGKRTTVVIFGRKFMSLAYLLSGVTGMVVMFPVWMELPLWSLAVPAVYIILHIKVWLKLRQATGTALNPLLGRTAVNLLLFSLLFISASLFV